MNIKNVKELVGSHTLSGVGYCEYDAKDTSGAPLKYGWFVLDDIKYTVFKDNCEDSGAMMCAGLKMSVPMKHEHNMHRTNVLCDVDHDFLKIYTDDGITPVLIVGTTINNNIPEFVFDYTPENI